MGRNGRMIVLMALVAVGMLASCARKQVADSPDDMDSVTVVEETTPAIQAPEVWSGDEQSLIVEGALPDRPPEGIEPVPVAELQTVYFDYDKYNLRSDALATLQANLDWLRANPGKQVLIEGHCDERGSEEYNLSLGDKRAKEVMGYLLKANIAKNQVFTISYGEERSVDPGHDESAWSKNRRAEFKVYQ